VRHPDVQLADLAERQHGVVSRRQMTALGLSESAIRHRIEVRRLHRVYSSTYALALPLHRYARYMAAVLASGDGAVLSHRSAAHLLGMAAAPGSIDVTVACSGSRRRRGITVHVTRSMPEDDVTSVELVRCTTAMRTLVDLAGVVRHERQLRRALERAHELNIFDRIALDAVLGRSSGRRGIGLLRRLIGDLPDTPPPLASELERELFALLVAAGLPLPIVNAYIGMLQVDFHWPAVKLVVETDGRATHGHAIAFHRDRDRDLYLQERGWRVIRLTWRQISAEPERVAALLRRWLQPAGDTDSGRTAT
jgi:hypothetical protein